MKRTFLKFFVCSWVLACLMGCLTTDTASRTYTESFTRQAFSPSIASPHLCAETYLKRADQAQGVEAKELQLQAAENLIDQNKLNQANLLLADVLTAGGGLHLKSHKKLITAKWYLKNNEPDKAQSTLRTIFAPTQLQPSHQTLFYHLSAKSAYGTGNYLEALEKYVALSEHLEDTQQRQQVNQIIWALINQTSPLTLKRLQLSANSKTLHGWATLGQLIKRFEIDSYQKKHAFHKWQKHYPGHPGTHFIALAPEQSPQPNATTVQSARRIALLLPSEGPYASSAQAIREGFFAEFYRLPQSNREKITIQTYNTGEGERVTTAYEQAIRDEADFIVGPLTKREVQALQNARKSMPVLALNTLNNPSSNRTNLYFFGLPPEKEAEAIVQKAANAGFKRALILAPDNPWGQRMLNTLKQSWQKNQGEVVESLLFSQKSLEASVRRALSIEHSEDRAKKVRQILQPKKMDFQVRRRHDVDVIFLMASTDSARQIKPLLNYYYAGNLPVYSSSHVYNGQASDPGNQDLNGIVFCDMPWVLKLMTDSNSSKTNKDPRLFALGLDAFRLTQHLNQLIEYPNQGLQGESGLLTLDPYHRIQRTLQWATFEKGQVRLLNQGKHL